MKQALSILILLITIGLPGLAMAASQMLDGIVAIVNDDVVVRSELDDQVTQLSMQLQQQGTRLPPREVFQRQVLERLILMKLQLAAAKQAGIVVNDEILNMAIGNVAADNNMGVSEFRRALEADGIDYRAFREEMRGQIAISQLRRQQVLNRIVVTEQELSSFLAKNAMGSSQRADYHLFHILIATPEGATADEIEAAQGKAQRVLETLRRGADFKEVAVAESDGRQALEGGDLGWRNAAQLPMLFADVVANMERGDVSEPIRNASGFHIIKLEDYTGSERHIIVQTHARHILVRTSEITSDVDASTRLDQLKQRIEGGDDFEALARSHSDDKGSAIKGGDLGWVSPGDLVPEFEEEMGRLQPGQVSMPFRTPFGWHVVQVLDRREHDSTEQVMKSKARNAIRERKAVEEGELYLRRLRDEAYVEIRLTDLR